MRPQQQLLAAILQAEGERELDDVRASGAESLQTERSAHEAAWRRIKQEHDAENDEVR